jgi:hypothetical protein
MLKEFTMDPYGVHRYRTLTGQLVRAGNWMPTYYAYVEQPSGIAPGAVVTMLFVGDSSDCVPGVTLQKRGTEDVKSMQGLEGPCVAWTRHKVRIPERPGAWESGLS